MKSEEEWQDTEKEQREKQSGAQKQEIRGETCCLLARLLNFWRRAKEEGKMLISHMATTWVQNSKAMPVSLPLALGLLIDITMCNKVHIFFIHTPNNWTFSPLNWWDF